MENVGAEEMSNQATLNDEDVPVTETTENTEANDSVSIDNLNITKNSADILRNAQSLFANASKFSGNINLKDVDDSIIENTQISGDYVSGSGKKVDMGSGHMFFSDVYVMAGGEAKPNDTLKIESQIDLDDSTKIRLYLKEHQDSPYCTLLIVLSVFENYHYDLVCDECFLLYPMLAAEQREVLNAKGETIIKKRDDFEISREEAVEIFSIVFFQDKLISHGGSSIKTTFVGFSSEDHSTNILRCIFEEFISLRSKVADYLISLICSDSGRVVYYVAAINAIKKICDINPEFFINEIVVKLYEQKSIFYDIAVSEILCSIAKYSESIRSADQYLGFVSSKERDVHYYIITLLMSRTLKYKRNKIGHLMRPILRELLKQPRMEFLFRNLTGEFPEEDDYINKIDLFFNIGGRYAEYYIALVIELEYIISSFKKNDGRRDFMQFISLLFIQEDYRESKLSAKNPAKSKDMIFIRLILRDEEVVTSLVNLWGELLKNPKLSKFAKKFLDDYLVDRSGAITDEEYERLETFFVRLSYSKRTRDTIKFFLNNLATRSRNKVIIANKIREKIGGVYHE